MLQVLVLQNSGHTQLSLCGELVVGGGIN